MSGVGFLSIEADLTLRFGKEAMIIRGEGKIITCEFECLSAGYRLLRGTGRLDTLRRRLADFSQLLSAAGLSMIIRTPSRRLMTLGQGGQSTLMRLLGFADVRLHLR